MKSSLPLAARALGAALVLSLLPAAGSAASAAPTAPAAPTSPTAPTAPAAPTVSEREVMPHLLALQRIADRNGGTRAHGTPGYAESVAYVRRALDRAGFRTELRRFEHGGRAGWNLVADWPGGDPEHVLLVGAHLDSVAEGPGINDNGSGSAAVLATALRVAESGLRPARHLRFAWWGAEELGLVGSADYVGKLSDRERGAIDLYLNFDQTGSRGTRQWLVVQDGPGADEAAGRAFASWFAARGLATFDVGVGGSDNESFGAAGIPSSGFSTGISDCIHEACDDLANVDPATETVSTNALIGVVWQLAAARS